MKAQWDYSLPDLSDQLAPYIPLIVKNPLREEQMEKMALVDTGFDGYLALSEKDFLSLGLDEFEVPYKESFRAESYNGKPIEIRTAMAEIIIRDLKIKVINYVDAVKGASEILVGRKFIESFLISMNGPKCYMELTLEN